MDETMNQSVEMTGEDDFFFDPEDFPEAESGDQTDEAAEETVEGEAEGTSQQQDEAASEEGAPEEAEGTPAAGNQWEEELNFLGQTRKVGREEGIKLMQQGLNHDRMKEQRDAMRGSLQEQLNWRQEHEENIRILQDIAKESDMNLTDFVRSMQENTYVRQGLSRDAAKERVEREALKRQLDAKTSQERQQQEQENAQKTRAQREISDFSKQFPDVDPKSIPKEVFDQAAAGGVSLTGAYISHLNSQLKAENERLKTELNAHKKNEENKRNAVGSAKTQGNDSAYDHFLRGFDEE